MKNIFSNFIKATTLCLGLFLTTPVVAQQVPSSVISGVSRPRESNFFRDGREKFEKEIQLLLKRRASPPENPLKVNQIQKIEQQPLKNPQVLPSNKH